MKHKTTSGSHTLLEAALTQRDKRMKSVRQRAEIAVAYLRREISGPDAAAAIGIPASGVASRLCTYVGAAITQGVVRVEFSPEGNGK